MEPVYIDYLLTDFNDICFTLMIHSQSRELQVENAMTENEKKSLPRIAIKMSKL
jgi:hypothetical protein